MASALALEKTYNIESSTKYTGYLSSKWTKFISNKLALDAYVIMYQSVIIPNAVCSPSDYGFDSADDIFEVIKLRVMPSIIRESQNSVYYNVDQIKQDIYRLLYIDLLSFDINKLNNKGTTTRFFTYFTTSLMNMRRDLSHWKVTSKYQTVYDAYANGKGKVCFSEDNTNKYNESSDLDFTDANEIADKAYDTTLIESLTILENCAYLNEEERNILNVICTDVTVIKYYNSSAGNIVTIDWKYLAEKLAMPIYRIRRVLATSIKNKLNTDEFYPSLDSQIEAVLDTEPEEKSLDDFIQEVMSLDVLLSMRLGKSFATTRNISLTL